MAQTKQKTMREQLQPIAPKERADKRLLNTYKHPSVWKGDGIDHINISHQGLTDLGKTLHPSAELPFTHNFFGNFNSIEAFWDYIATGARDERFRNGSREFRWSRKKNMEIFEIQNLPFFILDAMVQQILQYDKLKEAVIESNLPFDIYTYSGPLKVPHRNNKSFWLAAGMEDIRKQLKDGKNLNLINYNNGESRKNIFKRYKEVFFPNTLDQMQAQTKTNNLLDSLRKQQPPKASWEKAPLETTSKVEVTEPPQEPDPINEVESGAEVEQTHQTEIPETSNEVEGPVTFIDQENSIGQQDQDITG